MFGLDILIFTKLTISNIVFKKSIKKINSRNNGYIYGICNIIYFFVFGLHNKIGFALVS